MKVQLRKIVRIIADWPVIGRLIRIGVAVIRLPEFHHQYMLEAQQYPSMMRTLSDLSHRQHVFEAQQLSTLQQTLSDLNHRQHVFEFQQLPTLLQTLSDLNHRQLASDNDRDNLVKSVPVASRKITRELVDIQGQLENISNSVSHHISQTQEKLESMSNSVSYILGRVEFVRRELMFEMRYGASSPFRESDQLIVNPEILSPEKLATARNERLQLNLGCGHIPLKGYLNVDRRALPGVDIVADVDKLPFEQGEVDEIFSAHLLEHFPQEQLRRELLPYFFNLLKEGGEFHAVVPDAEAMIQEYSIGKYTYNDMREVLYGAQDYDGDFHFNMFTPDSLSELFLEAGFTNTSVIERGRKNGRCYEFEIVAKKPELEDAVKE